MIRFSGRSGLPENAGHFRFQYFRVSLRENWEMVDLCLKVTWCPLLHPRSLSSCCQELVPRLARSWSSPPSTCTLSVASLNVAQHFRLSLALCSVKAHLSFMVSLSVGFQKEICYTKLCLTVQSCYFVC